MSQSDSEGSIRKIALDLERLKRLKSTASLNDAEYALMINSVIKSLKAFPRPLIEKLEELAAAHSAKEIGTEAFQTLKSALRQQPSSASKSPNVLVTPKIDPQVLKWLGGFAIFAVIVASAVSLWSPKGWTLSEWEESMDTNESFSDGALEQEAGTPTNAQPLTFVKAGTMIQWDSSKDGDPRIYQIGEWKITLRSEKTGESLEEGGAEYKLMTSVLAVNSPKSQKIVVRGVVTGFAEAQFAVTETNQIVFATYSGEMDDYSNTKVVSLSQNKWTVADLGDRVGKPSSDIPRDLDGDGKVDFVFKDDRFIAALSDYESSGAPTQILNVDGERVLDVTREPRFQAKIRASMKANREGCSRKLNGMCAAYVADAASLGQVNQAWQFMLTHYDKASTRILEFCDGVDANNPCISKRKFDKFPAALEFFLENSGYTKGMQVHSTQFASEAGTTDFSSLAGCDSNPVKAEIDRTVIDGLRRAPNQNSDDRWWKLSDIKSTKTLPNGFACSASIQMGNSQGALKSLPVTFRTKALNSKLTIESFEIKPFPTETPAPPGSLAAPPVATPAVPIKIGMSYRAAFDALTRAGWNRLAQNTDRNERAQSLLTEFLEVENCNWENLENNTLACSFFLSRADGDRIRVFTSTDDKLTVIYWELDAKPLGAQ